MGRCYGKCSRDKDAEKKKKGGGGKVEKERRKQRKKGMTMMEMILVLGVLALFVGMVFAIYRTKVEPGLWSQKQFNIFQSVVAAIEHAKFANGGAYPNAADVDLGSTSEPSDPKARLVWGVVTGGHGAMSGTQGWKYTCDATNKKLIIDVNVFESPSDVAKKTFVDSVKNNMRFTSEETSDPDVVRFVRSNVLCN